MFIGYILLGLAVLLLASSLRIAQEYQRTIIFRLGRYVGSRGPGLFFLIPILERAVFIDIRTRTVNVEPQETITKDSVTARVNAVLFYKIVDAPRAILQVADYQQAVYQTSLTTLRNIIGQYILDDVLKERDKINETLQNMVAVATAAWGIEIQAVEMKDIEIPEGMQRAMAREAEAIREKRARVIKAQGEYEASERLSDSAKLMAANPAALELRRMQMVTEIGADNNTTTIVLFPSEFVSAAKAFANKMDGDMANDFDQFAQKSNSPTRNVDHNLQAPDAPKTEL